ncbi:MAG: hypothetical protein HY680_02560 [Chloroflexi bacterium]|nr:hypothetical protein [Chloroflexota bacterium]
MATEAPLRGFCAMVHEALPPRNSVKSQVIATVWNLSGTDGAVSAAQVHRYLPHLTRGQVSGCLSRCQADGCLNSKRVKIPPGNFGFVFRLSGYGRSWLTWAIATGLLTQQAPGEGESQ